MNSLKRKMLFGSTLSILALGYMVGCTHDNQMLNVAQSDGTELVSLKTSTPPSIDGVVDNIWATASKLYVTPVVTTPGNNLFVSYNGLSYPATRRSMYDDTYIYFLVEFADATSGYRPWLFTGNSTVTVGTTSYGPNTWYQRPNQNTFDGNGLLTQEGMGDDQVAFLWDIGSSSDAGGSTADFASKTCYASCHIFTPYLFRTTRWEPDPNKLATAPANFN